jgi:hypothetical protein
VDVSGNVVNVPVEGNLMLLAVRDPEQFDVLRKVLHEMKKTNFYLSLLLDIDVRSTETEGED